MNKEQIIGVLEEITFLLQLKGENPFKIRAYENGVRALETTSEDVGTLVREERLGELDGIGKALKEKISILVHEGSLPYHQELKASFPGGLMDLADIPGLGPRKIKTLYEELNVDGLDALERVCRDGKVASLNGFGAKTATNILEGIEQRRSYSGRHRYGDIILLAEELVDTLRSHPDVSRVSLAGSVRRGKEIIKDIDLIASSPNPSRVMEDFVGLEGVAKVVAQGETKSSVLFEGGVGCDLRIVADHEFANALHHFTGSKEHNVAMRQLALKKKMRLSEWGLFRIAGKKKAATSKEEGERLPCRSEEELFELLGLEYIPPELREGLGELEAAAENRIPRLIEWTDLRGCFHNHTTASDGKNSLREMAEAAQELGLEYLGIADHSRSSVQANGLEADRLLKQVADIRKLNKELKGIRLFSGIECDIHKDGSLDYEDEVLAELDYVVASVHSSFSLSEAAQTRRLIKAMENPHVTMLGHLTGRILLRREAYAVNVAKILDAAAETGTWMELNASPMRLDMDWRHWRKARDLGIPCVINPDAHATGQLGYLKFGVQIARKGWLRKEDVMNTRKVGEVEELLKK